MRPDRAVFTLLLALFFATGASGLGFQVLWAKAFAAGVGHEFPAVLAVVTAFMGGIALGAFSFDRIDWLRRDLRAYGALEIGIGLWGLASTAFIPAANRLAISIVGGAPHPTVHLAVVFTVIFVALLPATMAMGATFPALQRFVAAVAKAQSVGTLYASNTAGAMAGSLAAAFWLMPRFGIPGSIAALALVNLACGGAALLLAKSHPKMEGAPAAWPKLSSPALATRLAATGFLGIGIETAMIRGLSLVLENTVFTFAAILAVYFAATAFGAALQPRLAWSRDIRKLAAALALSALAGGCLLRLAPDIYRYFRGILGDTLLAAAASETAATALVLALPAAVMGAAFASLAERSLQFKPSLGWSLALNTSGAALAPPCVGLILLPAAGLNGTIALLAAGYALLAGRTRATLAAVPVALAAFLLPAGSDLLALGPGEQIVFYKEGAMAATAVVQDASGERVLKVNHRFQMGGTAARVAEQRHADIPLLLHRAPQRALFIGLGTGITFATASHYPGLEAEGVELLPEVAQATRLFQLDERTLERLGLKTHIADGRRFVASSSAKYDVIVADLFHPAQDGAAFLFTREHFAAVRGRLAGGGLFCQWLPVFQMNVPTLRTIARTFLEVYPEAEAWLLRFNVDTPVIGLIARLDREPFAADRVERRLAAPLAEHLRNTGLASTVRLLGCYIAGPNALRSFASAGRINSDAHPVVMFEAPRLAFQKRDDPAGRLLAVLEELRAAGLALPLEDAGLTRRIEEFIAARDVYLDGLRLEGSGNWRAAADKYLGSVRASADFTPAYAQAIALATALAKSDAAVAHSILQNLAVARPEVPVARELMERLGRP